MCLRKRINRHYINSLTFSAYAPVLLERKANKIRQNLVAEKGSYKHVRTIYESNDDRTYVNTLYNLCSSVDILLLDGEQYLEQRWYGHSNFSSMNQ